MPQKKVTRVEFPTKPLLLSQSTLLKRVAAYARVSTIEYSDLPSLEKAKIRNYLDQMDPAIKTDMQYHIRNGRLSMLRRMYMAVAFIS